METGQWILIAGAAVNFVFSVIAFMAGNYRWSLVMALVVLFIASCLALGAHP